MLSVKFSNKSAKFIRRLESREKKRIKDKINMLRVEPFPQNSVRVEGYRDHRVFRVRVGNFRILYSVFMNENLVLVIAIDKRSRVYK